MSRGWWSAFVIAGCTANPTPADRSNPSPAEPPAAAPLCMGIHGYALAGDRCVPLTGCGCPPEGCGPGVFDSESACMQAGGLSPAPSKPAPGPDFLREWSVCRQVVGERYTRCMAHWTEECNEALLAAAYRVTDAPAQTGSCYYHDRKSCPDCACPYYLKVGKVGFDGGTGCLQDLETLTRELRVACAAQRCES